MKPSSGGGSELQPTAAGDTLAVSTGVDGSRGVVPYTVGELLGRGGMGEVVLALDERIGRDVALKRIRPDEGSDDTTSRFLREAKIHLSLPLPPARSQPCRISRRSRLSRSGRQVRS